MKKIKWLGNWQNWQGRLKHWLTSPDGLLEMLFVSTGCLVVIGAAVLVAWGSSELALWVVQQQYPLGELLETVLFCASFLGATAVFILGTIAVFGVISRIYDRNGWRL